MSLLEVLSRIFSRESMPSKDIARERLRLVARRAGIQFLNSLKKIL